MKLGKISKFLCLIATTALIFAGCTNGNENSNNSNGKDQVEKLDKIVVGIPQDMDSLDPHLSNASGTQEIMNNIFTGLMSPTPSGEVVPEIAESYTNNEDMTVFTFKLRQNVKFHDGKALTSKDVKYTFDRLIGKSQDQQQPLSSVYAKMIESVEVVDEYTVVFNLIDTDVSFLTKMTIAIIPENSGSSQAKNPIGAGPYKFISYTPGVGMVFQKNDDFYIEGQPSIKDVEVKIYSDMNSAVLSLINREISLMIITEDIKPQIPTDKFYIVDYPTNTVQILGLNNNFEPFKNQKVREAINYAVDKDALISIVSPGAPKLGSNFSPVMSTYYDSSTENLYERDVEKAKALLKEAGYEKLKFTCKVATEYVTNMDSATVIEQQLKEVGITMEIVPVDWNTWLEEVNLNRNYEATVIGFTGKLDPSAILGRYVSDYSKNFINYNNPKYDEIIAKAAKEIDNEKRVEYYKEAQKILANSAASVFLMDPAKHMVIDNRIEGYNYYPIYFIDLRTLKFK